MEINEAVLKASMLQCKQLVLEEEHRRVLDLFGMTSKRIQCLLNNLVEGKQGINALEVGTYRGKSLIAFAVNPAVRHVDVIDNFEFNFGSEPMPQGNYNVINALNDNLALYKLEHKVTVHKTEFLGVRLEDITKPIDFIHFDTKGTQRDITTFFRQIAPALNEEIILVVSGFNDSIVRLGVEMWITQAKRKKLEEVELQSSSTADDSGWWAGVKVYRLR